MYLSALQGVCENLQEEADDALDKAAKGILTSL